jgi:hypothetical protein
MEMQKSVGQLTAKVDRLIDDVHGHGKDISGINTKINYFLGAAACCRQYRCLNPSQAAVGARVRV